MIAFLSAWLSDALDKCPGRRAIEATPEDLKPYLLDNGYDFSVFWPAVGAALVEMNEYTFPSKDKILMPLALAETLVNSTAELGKLEEKIKNTIAANKLSRLLVCVVSEDNGNQYPAIVGPVKDIAALKKSIPSKDVKKASILYGFDYDSLTNILAAL